MDALLAITPLDRATGRAAPGDFSLLPDGQLVRGGGMVFVGAQLCHTDLLAEVDEKTFSLNRIWDIAAARGRLYGAVHEGGWCDVGHPGGIALAEAILDRADA